MKWPWSRQDETIAELQERLAAVERELNRQSPGQGELKQLLALIEQQGLTLRALTAAVEKIGPSVRRDVQADDPSREEALRHLYLAQAVSPAVTITIGFVPTALFLLWGIVGDSVVEDTGGRAMAWAATASLVVVLFLAVFGMGRIERARTDLIEQGKLTIDEAKGQPYFERVATFPLPEKLAMWFLILLVPVFITWVVTVLLLQVI